MKSLQDKKWVFLPQVITFVHTLMRRANRKKTKIRTCMVVCPLNTVLNWQSEFEKWLDPEEELDVSETVN